MFLGVPRASADVIPHGSVELISENQSISPGQQEYFGFSFELEKGWHIYWLNPGDSGQPPQFEWHLPRGFAHGEIEWPAPQRIGSSSIVDFGYEGSVVLLVPVRVSADIPSDGSEQIGVNLKVLVCREICIPGRARVSLNLPIKSNGPEVDTRNAKLFAAARQSMPKRPPSSWSFTAIDQTNSFVLVASLGSRSAGATFFPLEESQVDNSARQDFVPTAGGFRLTVPKSDQLLNPIKRLRGVLEFPNKAAYLLDVAVEKPQ
jgi:thiol:disulfide interchange protein DsbD